MKKNWKWISALVILTVIVLTATGCQRDAQVASMNLSKAADMFEIQRRVVFVNGITGQYLLSIEGRCSINDSNRQLEVTCKRAEGQFVKHFLGLSDNVTYFAEQMATADVSVYHNRIIFKPQAIVPELDINTDVGDLLKNRQ
jgi:hypothetical protein